MSIAWSTSFWTDGSSGPSACGRGCTENAAAITVAQIRIML